MRLQPAASHSLLISEASRSDSDTPHSVRIPWTSDQADFGLVSMTIFTKKRLHSVCFQGSAMAQAVSHRPLTAEVLFQSQISQCGICDGQSRQRNRFLIHYFAFPLSLPLRQISIRIVQFITDTIQPNLRN